MKGVSKIKSLTLHVLVILVLAFQANAQFPLGGNYTIDPSLAAGNGNYQSFTSFANDINGFGMLGNVTVDVKEGTYNESFSLGDILGAGAGSSILIRSNPTNVDQVILNNTVSNSTGGTLTLAGTKFIRFEGIEFTCDPSLTYQRLVYVTGNLSDVSFDDCKFTGNLQTTNSFYDYVFYGSGMTFLGSGLSITNSDFYGGGDVFYLRGVASTHSTNFTVQNCEFIDNYGDWFYCSYWDDLNIMNNDFLPQAMTSTCYAIYFTNATAQPGRKANIRGNNIQVDISGFGTFYGVYLTYFSALPGDPSLIANNFIQNVNTTGTSTRYGIYTSACANLDVVHNTIKLQDGSASLSRAMYFAGTTAVTAFTPGGYNVANNIVTNYVNGSNGNLMYVTADATGYFTSISNNLYHGPNTSVPFYFGTQQTSLAAWETASGDVNSLEGNPQFFSATNLHTEGFLASGNGVNWPSVTDDIDGDARPLPAGSNVDIGADEFIPPTCPAPINLAWLGGTSSSANFNWNGASANEWALEYGPTGFTPGTGTTNIVSGIPAALTGLQGQMFYDVYVRSICGVDDTSSYHGPVTFNTFGQGLYMDADADCGPGFIDIAFTGVDLNLTDDSEAGITLPFPWLVQGQQIFDITVGNNGGVHFNSLTGNIVFSMTVPGLYPYTTDLDNVIAGVNQIGVLYETIGVAPNRKFVIEWRNRTRYPGSSNTNPCTFEIIYDEATTEIYYIYDDVDMGNPAFDNGGDAEIGLIGFGQDIEISIDNSTYLTENSCVRFYYTNCPKPQNFILAYVDTAEAGIQWNAGLSNETNWVVVYGPTGFDPTTSGNSITVGSSVALIPGLMQNTAYDVYVYALCANGDTSNALMGTFTTNARCDNPFDFSGGVGVDSLMMSWSWNGLYQSNYPITGFDLIYGVYEFDKATEGSAIQLGVVYEDTVVDLSFIPGGVYDVYLAARCGSEVSDSIGPITLIQPLENDNPCEAFDLPVDDVSRIFSNEEASILSNEQGLAPAVTGNREIDGWGVNDLTHTVWYTFKAPPSGSLRVTSADREYDGQLALYSVGDCQLQNTFQILAANDDELSGSSAAPNFTWCGLTPGDTYHLMFDSRDASEPGIYNMRLKELNITAGSLSLLDTVNICSRDTFNLFDALSGYSPEGIWNDIDQSNRLIQDSLFNTNGLPYEDYTFEYRVEEGCAYDSLLVEFQVFNRNHAGDDGVRDICLNQPFNLLSSLGGLVDHGGTWYDQNGVPMNSGILLTGEMNQSGSFAFVYVVDNGVCVPDSALVLVDVDGACDYTGIDEIALAGDLIVVYPNPTAGWLNLTWAEEIEVKQVEVLDMNGKNIWLNSTLKNVSDLNIDLSKFANGNYLVKIVTESGVVVRKISKSL